MQMDQYQNKFQCVAIDSRRITGAATFLSSSVSVPETGQRKLEQHHQSSLYKLPEQLKGKLFSEFVVYLVILICALQIVI